MDENGAIESSRRRKKYFFGLTSRNTAMSIFFLQPIQQPHFQFNNQQDEWGRGDCRLRFGVGGRRSGEKCIFHAKKRLQIWRWWKTPWKLRQGNHFYHFPIACAFSTPSWGVLRCQILCQATHEGTNAIFQSIFDHFHTKFTCNSRIIRSPNPIPECSSSVTNSFCPILPHFTPFWTLICHFLMFLPRLGLVTLIAASTRTSIRIHLCPYF